MRKDLACMLGGSGMLFMTASPARIYSAHVRISRIFARMIPVYLLFQTCLKMNLQWIFTMFRLFPMISQHMYTKILPLTDCRINCTHNTKAARLHYSRKTWLWMRMNTIHGLIIYPHSQMNQRKVIPIPYSSCFHLYDSMIIHLQCFLAAPIRGSVLELYSPAFTQRTQWLHSTRPRLQEAQEEEGEGEEGDEGVKEEKRPEIDVQTSIRYMKSKGKEKNPQKHPATYIICQAEQVISICLTEWIIHAGQIKHTNNYSCLFILFL